MKSTVDGDCIVQYARSDASDKRWSRFRLVEREDKDGQVVDMLEVDADAGGVYLCKHNVAHLIESLQSLYRRME